MAALRQEWYPEGVAARRDALILVLTAAGFTRRRITTLRPSQITTLGNTVSDSAGVTVDGVDLPRTADPLLCPRCALTRWAQVLDAFADRSRADVEDLLTAARDHNRPRHDCTDRPQPHDQSGDRWWHAAWVIPAIDRHGAIQPTSPLTARALTGILGRRYTAAAVRAATSAAQPDHPTPQLPPSSMRHRPGREEHAELARLWDKPRKRLTSSTHGFCNCSKTSERSGDSAVLALPKTLTLVSCSPRTCRYSCRPNARRDTTAMARRDTEAAVTSDPGVTRGPARLLAYGDESMRRLDGSTMYYLFAAATVAEDRCPEIRAAMIPLLRGKRGTLHWRDEDQGGRERITRSIREAGITSVVVVAAMVNPRGQERVRQLALRQLLWELDQRDVAEVVLESRNAERDRHDLRSIGGFRNSRHLSRRLHVQHGKPVQEPMLWVPDAVAGAAGDHRCGNPVCLDDLGHLVEVIDLGRV